MDEHLNDPISETAHKYKRNMFALAFVAVLVWQFPKLKFEKVPPLTALEGTGAAPGVAVTTLLLLLIFQWGLYWYYSERGITEWIASIEGDANRTYLLPYWELYLERPVTKKSKMIYDVCAAGANKNSHKAYAEVAFQWNRVPNEEIDKDGLATGVTYPQEIVRWRGEGKLPNGEQTTLQSHAAPKLIKSVRQRLILDVRWYGRYAPHFAGFVGSGLYLLSLLRILGWTSL